MKEFIVNGHKLATVECDIAPRCCPVYNNVLADKASSGKLALAVKCDGGVKAVFDASVFMTNARALKLDIMNQCMDCNVKAR